MEHGLPEGRFSVVYGNHPSVSHIVDELVASGRDVALVADVDPAEVHRDVHFMAGDPTSEVVIRKSHPERAADALVVGTDDGDVLVTCVALRAAAPDLPIFALANSAKIAQALRDLGIHRTLSSDELVAHTLAKSLEAPHAGDLLLRLIDSERYSMDERPAADHMVGKLATEIELDRPAIVFGLIRDGDVKLVLDEDCVVRAADVVVSLTARA